LSDISLGTLLGALISLVVVSAFFSAAEIAMVSLNRHRLRHLSASGHRGARIAEKLLARPDRLISVILLGSNAVNALFATLTTLTVVRLLGEDESAIGIATVVITLVVLILTDLAPKTLATLHPERIALPSAYVLRPLLWIIYPIVWVINGIANGLLLLIGIRVQGGRVVDRVAPEELKTMIMEAGVLIPESHQDMLIAILDLEKTTVEDVMIPRNRIEDVNIDAEWPEVVDRLTSSNHTRMPAYRGSPDNVVGIIHARRVLNLQRENRLNPESLKEAILEPYFIPAGTSLTTQLLNFRETTHRMGLVVDEYGDLKGLVTLDEVVKEIVGDFATRAIGRTQDLAPESDGSYILRGATSLRELNRKLDWNLPIDGTRTLNGLILEYLEDIPEQGTSLMIGGYQVEIMRTRGTAIETARIRRVQNADKDEQKSG
jgi:Mg2+/Co2+ transporter CorB